MINLNLRKQFCREDISLIQNYELAINDPTQTWHYHHRLGTVIPRKKLIEMGLYYNRPAIELIFLTPFEHNSIHHKNNKPWNKGLKDIYSKETIQKMSESKKGKHLSEETIQKMSKSLKGLNTWLKGRKLSEEHKQKMSKSLKGVNTWVKGTHRVYDNEEHTKWHMEH